MRSINLLHRTQSTSEFSRLKELLWVRGKWIVGFYLILFFPTMLISVWIDYQTKTTQQQQQELRTSIAQLNTAEVRARQVKRRIAQVSTIVTPKVEIVDVLEQIVRSITTEGITLGMVTIEQNGQVRIHATAINSAPLQDLERKFMDFGTAQKLASIDVSGISYEATKRQFGLDVVLNLY